VAAQLAGSQEGLSSMELVSSTYLYQVAEVSFLHLHLVELELNILKTWI
jgi:hypothetical protein